MDHRPIPKTQPSDQRVVCWLCCLHQRHWLSLPLWHWQSCPGKGANFREGWPKFIYFSCGRILRRWNKGFAKCMHIPEERPSWPIVRACSSVAACSKVRVARYAAHTLTVSALRCQRSLSDSDGVNDIFPRLKTPVASPPVPFRWLKSPSLIKVASKRSAKTGQI